MSLLLKDSYPDDIDIQDKEGNTALMISAELGDYTSTMLLLKYQALVNVHDVSECTALMRAVSHGKCHAHPVHLQERQMKTGPHSTEHQKTEYVMVTELLLQLC